MNKKELELCIKVLRRTFEYPNQEGMQFVIKMLEDDLEMKLKKWTPERKEKFRQTMKRAWKGTGRIKK